MAMVGQYHCGVRRSLFPLSFPHLDLPGTKYYCWRVSIANAHCRSRIHTGAAGAAQHQSDAGEPDDECTLRRQVRVRVFGHEVSRDWNIIWYIKIVFRLLF